MSRNGKILAIAAAVACAAAMPQPKLETSSGGKSQTEGKGGGNQLAMESTRFDVTELPTQERPPRFGFATYNSDVQGYSQNGIVPGVYGPVKLDIGGLLLGTIVGLGAFFILPKLLHVTTPYGAYKRSEDDSSEIGSSIHDVLAKVRESLDKYDIDSTACLQRAICNSIESANERSNSSIAGSLDSVVESIAKNDLTKSLVEGTEWKKAVDVGERGGNCGAAFPNCPVSLDSVASAVAKYLLS